MGSDRTTGLERVLTLLSLWGVLRLISGSPVSLTASILLCLTLAQPVSQLVPAGNTSALFFFAACVGVLLGLVSSYTAGFWDRSVFDACYGAQRPPSTGRFGLLPSGVPLAEARTQVLHALDATVNGPSLDVEAVKIARRQAERWARIERFLILANTVRGLLWPCVFSACFGLVAAIAAAQINGSAAAPLLGIGFASLALFAICLGPYCRFRLEYLTRLYDDVAEHSAKKKHLHGPKHDSASHKPGRTAATHRHD